MVVARDALGRMPLACGNQIRFFPTELDHYATRLRGFADVDAKRTVHKPSPKVGESVGSSTLTIVTIQSS
jgi:hypothetical protein